MKKKRVLNQSINQLSSLFDAPGTEAFASKELNPMSD